MNLRGEVLPVFSLRTKFGLQEIPTNELTKIIVTKSNGVTIAFKVDEVKEIIECDESKLTEFPSIARSQDTAYVERIANHNGRLILLLNQDRLLKADEAEAISQLVSNV
jgi:purine-binding chemotaxis protein CheW